ncbi:MULTISPECIES: 5-formyltetrahydrofolate cyclo-ligase [unclassified Streptomyces]|uniref:5-formyltetrahydrofolate cyclo-ligase n=1 Tax=unclassified Streptomyces TaxID=2593676 RepID=UPI00081EDE94|nr:5-formyltetrahydrofolate cyclo-ligase [Streptomyces sp. ScaeMP-e83]MYR93643.1 5-formyltetrahydrofolate cyclo-ligase [Streptomyces sp. SID4937]SCD56543.1 5-formyltetrahydrofolate cyclo-ligase [Streptomyces sp. ScaeMP-e83]
MAANSLDEAKQTVREQIWSILTAADAAHDASVHGRIPNFKGSEKAAARLASLPVWQRASVVKAVPDKAQLPVRARALEEGKTVYMAVPKLATLKPFYLLDPATLTVPPTDAANSTVAATIAPTVEVDALRPLDLIILGSVAVNRDGARIGKGAGYSDIEFALLSEAGLVTTETVVVTTVHALQVTETSIPTTEHDVSVDLIVTPKEIITCANPHRPTGINWAGLRPEKIGAIPALAARHLG